MSVSIFDESPSQLIQLKWEDWNVNDKCLLVVDAHELLRTGTVDETKDYKQSKANNGLETIKDHQENKENKEIKQSVNDSKQSVNEKQINQTNQTNSSSTNIVILTPISVAVYEQSTFLMNAIQMDPDVSQITMSHSIHPCAVELLFRFARMIYFAIPNHREFTKKWKLSPLHRPLTVRESIDGNPHLALFLDTLGKFPGALNLCLDASHHLALYPAYDCLQLKLQQILNGLSLPLIEEALTHDIERQLLEAMKSTSQSNFQPRPIQWMKTAPIQPTTQQKSDSHVVDTKEILFHTNTNTNTNTNLELKNEKSQPKRTKTTKTTKRNPTPKQSESKAINSKIRTYNRFSVIPLLEIPNSVSRK